MLPLLLLYVICLYALFAGCTAKPITEQPTSGSFNYRDPMLDLYSKALDGNKDAIKEIAKKVAKEMGKSIEAADDEEEDDEAYAALCITFAILSGHKEAMELLLKNQQVKEVLEKKKKETGQTILHMMAAIPDEFQKLGDLLDVIVASGVDVNTTDNKGNTALHKAAKYGSEAVVKLLLSKHADKTLKNNENRTPLEQAQWVLDSETQLAKDRKENIEACISLFSKQIS